MITQDIRPELEEHYKRFSTIETKYNNLLILYSTIIYRIIIRNILYQFKIPNSLIAFGTPKPTIDLRNYSTMYGRLVYTIIIKL